MLQEKSLSEGEDGFTTGQTAGHVEAAAGSPALGVAGLSNSLSSPQSQDPEQVSAKLIMYFDNQNIFF